MPFKDTYRKQVALLVRTLPAVAEQELFALKGGTAINLFVRDMPRLSVDIDLTYVPVEPRAKSLVMPLNTPDAVMPPSTPPLIADSATSDQLNLDSAPMANPTPWPTASPTAPATAPPMIPAAVSPTPSELPTARDSGPTSQAVTATATTVMIN